METVLPRPSALRTAMAPSARRLRYTALLAALACGGDTRTGPATGAGDTGTADRCASSACNGIDDDCDGLIDEPSEPATPRWFADADDDGFGDPERSVTACEPPVAHVANADDCDDSDPARHPDAWDAPSDGVDSDCDGTDAVCLSDGSGRALATGDVRIQTLAEAAALCASHDGTDGMLIIEDSELVDLESLHCLCVATGGLRIADNAQLASLNGLPPGRHLGRHLELTGNPLLDSTAGLSHSTWTSIASGGEQLVLRGNDSLADVEGFEGLRSLDLLQIRDLPRLSVLGGLPDLEVVTESLEIRDNASLQQVAGLGQLVAAAELRVEDNPLLVDLSGLTALRSPRYLTVGGNALADLSDFAGVQAIDARLTVRNTTEMTDLAGLVGLQRLGGLVIQDNLGLTGLGGLADAHAAGGIGGAVELVGNPGLEDLRGLEWVRWIDGDLHLGTSAGPSRLSSLEGLHQLVWLTGDLSVARQRELPDLTGLGALEEVGGLRVDGSGVPPSIGFSLRGLDRLRQVHGTLDLRDNAGLTDLTGLDAVVEVDNLVVMDNPALSALTGLEQLRSVGDLIVLRNPLLGDVSALEGLTRFGDICVDAPANPDEPATLLATLDATERCP